MGLVEQPQSGAPHQHGRQGDPASLPGGQAGDVRGAQAPVEPQPRQGLFRRRRRGGDGAGGKGHVVGDGEIVVEKGGVTEEPHPPADRPPVPPEVVAEDDGLAADDRHQTGTGAQQRRLPRPIRAGDQHDLTRGHVEVDARQGGEPAEQGDRGAKADGGFHDPTPEGTGPLHGPAKRRLRRERALRRRPRGVRRVTSDVGRTLIAAGVLILLFVGYQLWGTNLYEARAQRSLEHDFRQALAASTTVTTTTTGPTTTTAPPLPPPEGEAVALIRIRKINLEKAVVEGTGVPDLKKGPGHYTGTPLPGQAGNAAIAGHRTTYGAPFWSLDELVPGDLIETTTHQGHFFYEVTGSQIVNPEDAYVLDPTEDNRLTLTTCHPRFSAAKRLIVTARLTIEPVATPPTTVPRRPVQLVAEANLSGESASNGPAIAWGVLAALVWLLTWLVSRWDGRRGPAFLVGTPAFLVVLFFFFENVARLLPANV